MACSFILRRSTENCCAARLRISRTSAFSRFRFSIFSDSFSTRFSNSNRLRHTSTSTLSFAAPGFWAEGGGGGRGAGAGDVRELSGSCLAFRGLLPREPAQSLLLGPQLVLARHTLHLLLQPLLRLHRVVLEPLLPVVAHALQRSLRLLRLGLELLGALLLLHPGLGLVPVLT